MLDCAGGQGVMYAGFVGFELSSWCRLKERWLLRLHCDVDYAKVVTQRHASFRDGKFCAV